MRLDVISELADDPRGRNCLGSAYTRHVSQILLTASHYTKMKRL